MGQGPGGGDLERAKFYDIICEEEDDDGDDDEDEDEDDDDDDNDDDHDDDDEDEHHDHHDEGLQCYHPLSIFSLLNGPGLWRSEIFGLFKIKHMKDIW